MIRTMTTATLLAWFGCVSPAAAADNPSDGDIRDIKVGAPVTGLALEGYGAFRCVGSDQTLERWVDYTRCPKQSRGLYEIRFEFVQTNAALANANDRWSGTRLSGHPVLLSILIDAQGDVAGIRVNTDPKGAPYLRKKAYLLGLRVRERYGEEGWTCTDRPPGPGEAEVGGMFVNRICEKADHGRRLVLETKLHRAAGQTGRDFESSTHFEILAAGV